MHNKFIKVGPFLVVAIERIIALDVVDGDYLLYVDGLTEPFDLSVEEYESFRNQLNYGE